MKFSAERETILAPLQAVIGLVERRQTMPILANVLVVGRGEQLSIGFAPLHRVQPAPRAASRTLQAQFDWMVRYLSTTQYLQRLRELKDAIPGPEEQRYVASYTRAAPTVLHAFLRAMNVQFGPLFGPRLLRVLSQGVRARVRDKLPAWAPSRRV